MMKLNKYLIHDVYHITTNLEIIHGIAEYDEIVKHTLLVGERDNRGYTEEQIQACLKHFTTIKMICEVETGKYKCLI